MNQVKAGKIKWHWSARRDQWEHDRVDLCRIDREQNFSPLTHNIICQCGEVMHITIHAIGGELCDGFSENSFHGSSLGIDAVTATEIIAVAECDCDDPSPVVAVDSKLNIPLYREFEDMKAD